MLDLTAQVTALADRVHARRADQPRVLVALAGAPGSGKSTLATELARRLRDQRLACEVVPMDGFHLDNAVLDARGLRARKGSPETFDADGFVHLVRRLIDLRRAFAGAPYESLPAPEGAWVYRRGHHTIALNLGAAPVTIDLPGDLVLSTRAKESWDGQLQGHEAVIVR